MSDIKTKFINDPEKITAEFAEGDPDKQPELTTWYLG